MAAYMTDDELNNLPADSYAGHERDLADLLDDDTLEYYETMVETYDENYTSWALFNLLMMHKAAFLAMIDLGGADPADALELRLQVQADANDGSGDAFQARLEQRLATRKTLRRLTENYRRHTETNKD